MEALGKEDHLLRVRGQQLRAPRKRRSERREREEKREQERMCVGRERRTFAVAADCADVSWFAVEALAWRARLLGPSLLERRGRLGGCTAEVSRT
eukprot:3662594-Rhodomonas_salina.3